jgi:hypothetical protein
LAHGSRAHEPVRQNLAVRESTTHARATEITGRAVTEGHVDVEAAPPGAQAVVVAVAKRSAIAGI